jgi:Ca2+-transporting ATPase
MKGLTSSQARQFLDQYGLNVISEQKKRPYILKFFDQFSNFLTLLLVFAAGASFIIGEKIDGELIIGIVILNAFFGLYQEGKAEEAVKLLKKMTISKVRVIRDGKEIGIDSQNIVPGDVVVIEEGVKIPADGIIIQERNMEINESTLTGESMPVIKEMHDEVFMGTVVSKGRGLIEITKTGMNTKFGEIAFHMRAIEDPKTPLQKKLEGLTRLIGILGIVISVLVFGLSIFEGSGYFPAFLLAVSLAVAVVPEGLPAVMTITLAMGMKELAKRKAIVRKLSAIEALGAITLIATDKTGTLTKNKMKVKELFIDGSEKKNFISSSFSLLLLNGILCSTASLVTKLDDGEPDVLGDPTEGALLYLAHQNGLSSDKVRREWEIVDEMPFDSETKMMTVQAKKNKQIFILSKGAPESILGISNKIRIGEKEENLTPAKVKEIEKTMQGWARNGLRILAFAYKEDGSEKRANQDSPLHSDMVFLGMVALHDPPRIEVVDALKKANEAGIKTVMITGDNEITAEAIATSVGLMKKGDEIMTGKQIDKYSDKELLQSLSRVKVFARTSPTHKYRIVSLYQKLGEIVAVTGDGVNDAIALKQADVGIAMGRVGTDVARETADMVITDDNFATIVNAIEEGRNIIKNLKNAIKYLLSCNIGEALSLVLGLAIGIPTIFYPIQLLYINLVTDGLPALSLAFSPRHPGLMRKKPQKEMTILEPFDKKYIFIIGTISSLLVLFSYFYFEKSGLGKTAAFCVLTLIQSFIFIDLWLSHNSIRKHINQLTAPIFLIAFIFPFIFQFIIIRNPTISVLFKVSPTSNLFYFEFIVLAGMILIGIKVVKKFLLKYKNG